PSPSTLRRAIGAAWGFKAGRERRSAAEEIAGKPRDKPVAGTAFYGFRNAETPDRSLAAACRPSACFRRTAGVFSRHQGSAGAPKLFSVLPVEFHLIDINVRVGGTPHGFIAPPIKPWPPECDE